MQISNTQWLFALAIAVGVHIVLLVAFLIGGFNRNEAPDSPQGVMVSLDQLNPGPPPEAMAAQAPIDAPTPEVAAASAPPATETNAPDASAAAPPEAAEAVANIGPDPAESPASSSTGEPNAAAEAIEAAPVVAPAAEPANAVAVAPINAIDAVEPTEQVTAQAPEIATAETREIDSDANGAYGSSDESTEDYIVRLRAWLSRHKEYPAAARQAETEGTVRLYIVVDQNGRIVSRRITQSSGSEMLDRAAEQMLTRAEPLPRMPTSMRRNRLELVVPVVFSLR
ncbi:TonB-like protein [Salinisphaera shabanensis E1L3A]|uniref:TonB-like protein n=1 Tax=Salinisphaera shabanensis E1L3A TaxID=1033802 RepID=U2EMX5_9GAMM|nr:energy transducer TonB [Salinisphaera shabanensis]ERJ19507.1 TonB-like protein [Salinisphaera shabanensis E1L3A]